MRVTLARDFKHQGRVHKADATVDLPDHVARNLMHVGLARKPAAEAPAKATEQTKEG